MNANHPCFCGSNANFSSCCQRYIKNTIPVKTAEQLMRSRFSAYATGDAQYIYDTYAKSSRAAQSVKDIDDWSKSCVWIALNIHPTASNDDKTSNIVEFSAFYITNNTLCELREKSRFVIEESTHHHPLKQWYYLDGDIISHTELANIKRNELCPCNHYATSWQVKKGKKFKHCCGK